MTSFVLVNSYGTFQAANLEKLLASHAATTDKARLRKAAHKQSTKFRAMRNRKPVNEPKNVDVFPLADR